MANGLRFKTARDLFAACPAASQDMTAIPTDQPSLEFCRSLLAGRIPEEAITFCAYLLPGRAAVWWAHECLGELAEVLDAQDGDLLAAVRDWVSEPGESRRLAALDMAKAAQAMTPAVWIALAAGSDETSPLAMRMPGAAGRQWLFAARAVNTGILAGLARVAPADREPVLTAFADMGMELARDVASHSSAAAW
jgi:hypothetical protein